MSEDFGPPDGTSTDSHREAVPEATVVALFGDTVATAAAGMQPPMSDAEFLERLRGKSAAQDRRPIGIRERPLSAAVLAAVLLPHPFERIVRFRHQAQRQGVTVDVAFWEEALHQLVLITSPSGSEED